MYAKDIVCMAPDVDPIDKTPKKVPGCIPQPQDFSPAAQVSEKALIDYGYDSIMLAKAIKEPLY